MKRLILIGIWLAALIIDGVILSALRGGPAGFGTLVFLIALILSFGIHRWVIGWGMAAAFCAELMLGLYLGTLMGAWLVIVWLWYIVNRFLSLKLFHESDSWFTFVPLTAFGIMLFVAAEISEWAIIRVMYQRMLTFLTVREIIASSNILMTVGAELLILLVVLRFIYVERTSLYD